MEGHRQPGFQFLYAGVPPLYTKYHITRYCQEQRQLYTIDEFHFPVLPERAEMEQNRVICCLSNETRTEDRR